MRFLTLFLCIGTLFAHDGSWDRESTDVITEKRELLTIGIICAHPNELGLLHEKMEGETYIYQLGGRSYVCGDLWGIHTVLAVSKVGKVAAATTATQLISGFNADLILCTGVCGSAEEGVNIGDIVIAHGLIQHDMDSSPLTPPFTIPFLNVKVFKPDHYLQRRGCLSAYRLFDVLPNLVAPELLEEMGIEAPKVVSGVIGTGDHFFADKVELALLKEKLPELTCVEMEGAAIAQVCYEYQVPCCVMRVVSDNADETAHIDCLKFMREVASIYTREMIDHIYGGIKSYDWCCVCPKE